MRTSFGRRKHENAALIQSCAIKHDMNAPNEQSTLYYVPFMGMGCADAGCQRTAPIFSTFSSKTVAATVTAINMKNDYNNAIMNSTYSAHVNATLCVCCGPAKRTDIGTSARL